MELSKIFRLPYGYVEEKSFESKESQIDEQFDENSEINLRQDEKDKEHDQAVKDLQERDKGHDQAVLNLMERDARFDQAVINLMNSDNKLDQKINSLTEKVNSIENNGNNNGTEISELKAKDAEHDQIIEGLNAKDAEHYQAISELKAKDSEHDQIIEGLNAKDAEHYQAISELKAKDAEHDQAITNLINTDANLLQKVNSKLDKSIYDSDKVTFALKSELPSIDGLASEEWVGQQGFLTEHQDISSKLDVAQYDSDKAVIDEQIASKASQESLNALNTLVGNVSNILKGQIEAETAERKENDKDVVKTTAIPSEDMPNRKAIVMENHDALMGKSSSGKVNVAMISKYDVADFGSKAVHCNLNGKYPRPTYNDNQPIAVFEDIENSKESTKTQLDVLMTKISQLEDKLSKYGEDSAIKIDGSADVISHNDVNTNAVISGTFSNDVSVIGKDVIIKDLTTTSGKNHRFSSDNGEVSLKGCNYSGDHPKAVSNTEIGIQCNDVVNVKNCKFNTTTYNQLEVSLDSNHTVKGVNVDNCIFGGKKSNNAMSIFGLKDNAVINITNCVFEDVSNPLRISNHSNAKNVVINIVDCKVNKWEANLDYHGFICFQDYTSGSKELEAANKQFSTMIVNFVNLTTPDGKLLPMKDQSEYCGSKDSKQLVYVYYNKTGLIPYSKDIYPTVNIK